MAAAEIQISITDTDEFAIMAKCLNQYVDMDISATPEEYELREKSRKSLCAISGEKYEPDLDVVGCYNCFYVTERGAFDICPQCGD